MKSQLSLDLTDDQSRLVHVMDWCYQVTSPYLSQCWPRYMSPYGVTRPPWVKGLIIVVTHHTQHIFHMVPTGKFTSDVPVHLAMLPAACTDCPVWCRLPSHWTPLIWVPKHTTPWNHGQDYWKRCKSFCSEGTDPFVLPVICRDTRQQSTCLSSIHHTSLHYASFGAGSYQHFIWSYFNVRFYSSGTTTWWEY